MKIIKNKIQIILSLLLVLLFVVFISVFKTQEADNENILKIYFFDVGQGDSQYIKLPNNEDILIDGGPDDTVLSELGKSMDINDKEISLMVLTHPHADHINGLIKVLDRYKVKEVWGSGVDYSSSAYDAFKEKIKQNNIPYKKVYAGENRKFSFVNFQILYPLASLENKKMDNVNNSSVVSQLNQGNFKVLFLGDAEKKVQEEMIDLFSNVTIVKVSHHGSINGTVENVLKKIRPAIAIISVGKNNNYNHPSQQTLNLLRKYLVSIYRIDQNGTIEVNYDGKKYQIK